MALIECKECKKEISDKATSCPHCGIALETPEKEYESELMKAYEDQKVEKKESNKWTKIIILAVFIFIAYGTLRVYTGGGLGFKITTKDSFSFTDTFVNLDDVLGKPNFVFSSEHPAVKKQLQKMGVIETDEQMQERIEADIKAKQEEMMKDIESQQAKAMAEYQEQMRQLGY